MPNITVVYWNIENFGTLKPLKHYKANYNSLIPFIASVVQLTQADILCIQELKPPAIPSGFLQSLQQTLMGMPAPMNNW
jgi:hypothetical protein